ncbi:hypothetical protein PIB30_081470 [Stylosanthes scabra]|uniref:DUF4283 domain-containing protein n=1 Tax=Stylosanthes scabra TaxID=79078 RepID=A0ABU6UQI4_9FABA|nr:hypothetical protein [Stylosanthes scabra]
MDDGERPEGDLDRRKPPECLESSNNLHERSAKKVRKEEDGFYGSTSRGLVPRVEEWMLHNKEGTKGRSYASMVTGDNRKLEDDFLRSDDSEEFEDEDMNSEGEEVTEITCQNEEDESHKKESKKFEITVVDMGEGLFNILINEKEDLDHALLEGPWKIYDHYLAVRLREPNFNALLTSIDKLLLGYVFRGDNNKEATLEATRKEKAVQVNKDGNFGPSMVVRWLRRAKKDEAGPSNKGRTKEDKNANKSRFNVLEVEEANNEEEMIEADGKRSTIETKRGRKHEILPKEEYY